jgi:hypothetical protein
MIRHIVLVRFRSDINEAAIAALFAELHRIEGKIPGLVSIVSGRSESPEQMERGHKHGFVVDFTDWQGLQAYQDHPDHRALGAKLVAHAEGGKDGILVFDLPIPVETA